VVTAAGAQVRFLNGMVFHSFYDRPLATLIGRGSLPKIFWKDFLARREYSCKPVTNIDSR